MQYDFLIVGAGFAGSVMAERLASQLDKKILLIEKRSHIAGNAFDEYDEHNILVHRYGPHIFHTNSNTVMKYLSHFTEWKKYEHKILANLNGKNYPFPINRLTLNMLYNLDLKNDRDSINYFERVKDNRSPIMNSEDIIVNQIGYDLFEKFFRHYTKKQWNLYPNELHPQVCGRIPIRLNDDVKYFADKYQLMPSEGYTKMFKRMLANKNIEIIFNCDYKKIRTNVKFDKMIYTGPIDYFFDYTFGKLPYRSLKFEFVNYNTEFYQEAAQINYVNSNIPYTRVVEHKQLTGQKSDNTTISREYPQIEGEPYYPIPTEENRKIFLLYEKETSKLNNVVFCGRLAEYQYYNMDQVIANTLRKFEMLYESQKI